jgi:hypothetical protein
LTFITGDKNSGEMMYQFHKYQTRRTAEYRAKDLLVHEGYEVVRVTERAGALPILFHLIAWRQEPGIHLIRIGSSRMSSCTFNKEVERLSFHVKNEWYPGDVQFWIAKGGRWERYQILPGGAIPIMEQE